MENIFEKKRLYGGSKLTTKKILSETEWGALLHGIHKGNCILMLGPNIEYIRNNGNGCTLQNLLAQQLADEMENPPQDCSNFFHLAQLYNLEFGRNALEPMVMDFYCKKKETEYALFSRLASLPFHLIISSNHNLLILEALKKAGKEAICEYYHFRGPKALLVHEGNESCPLVYYLYGSVSDPGSLVLTEDNLLEFLETIISGKRPLPDNIRSKFKKKETSFLFLGFGFKNWFLRILIHLILKRNSENRSFALERFYKTSPIDFQQMVIFYKSGYKIKIIDKNVHDFVEELWRRNKGPRVIKEKGLTHIPYSATAPKIFISYASDDKVYSKELHTQLVNAGFDPWLDKQKLRGGDQWDDIIKDIIQKVDYFVVIQSKALSDRIKGYVNAEINIALEWQKRFREGIRFIIPVMIDDSPARTVLKEFHMIDLREKDGYKELISSIKRDYQRRQRR